MKLIATDNFAREIKNDELIAENVSEHFAKLIEKRCSKGMNENDETYIKAVADDYKLFERDY